MVKRRRALLSVIVEDDGPFWGTLLCPRCKGKRVHPISVSVNPAGDAIATVTIKADGIHIDKTTKRMGNSTGIRLTFGCSNGHTFAVSFDYMPSVLETSAGHLHPSEPKVGEYEILGRQKE